jgi:stalled ribosome rescue protein Dom34
MTTVHAAVWIDHSEAKIFHVDDERFDPKVVEPRHHLRRHNITTAEHAHPADLEHFFHDVAQALADVAEILVVGPGSAKLEFIKHVHKREHTLVPKIVGVETVDHPTDGQLVAFAHHYFHAKDRLGGIVP